MVIDVVLIIVEIPLLESSFILETLIVSFVVTVSGDNQQGES